MLLHRCLHPRETSQGSTEGSCLLIVRPEQLATELICSHSCGGPGWKVVVASAPAGLPPSSSRPSSLLCFSRASRLQECGGFTTGTWFCGKLSTP